MRHLPLKKYCGLSIFMDAPSRHDKTQLISGYAGQQFFTQLNPYSRLSCDIRTIDTFQEGLLPDTKSILVLGPKSHETFHGSSTTLMENRGSPYFYNGIPVIATFPPQDSHDFKDMEGTFEDEGSDEEDNGKGTKGRTPRKEWKFWLYWDIIKAVKYLREPIVQKTGVYHIYPPLDTVISLLRESKGKQLYLDIECTYDFRLTCIGFSFGWPDIYVVPFLRHDKTLAYEGLYKFMAALAIALRDNTVVIHNSMFDLFILCWKYRLPFSRQIYDTMCAHNRIFPEVAKALGHCISLYTDQSYHKNDGVYEPRNYEEEKTLWLYNARDIESLILVREAIDEVALSINGAPESIKQVNSSIYHYLITCLHGISWNLKKRDEIMAAHDTRRNQMLRIIRILLGEDLNPGSPPQMQEYLFEKLKLSPVFYTKKGAPSTDANSIYSLATKHTDIAIFPVLLDYRSSAKIQGTLKTEPWIL